MWKYKMVDIVREGSEPEMLKSIGKTRTFIRNGYSRVETMRNIAGAQCVLRVQFIRAWCRGISIYFTYGLWRSAAAAVLTRLCRPPARSYADNFPPTGNELNWKPRKRQGSGFVIYQTHALPNRFSLSLKMIYPLNYYYYYYSNRVIEGSSHARFITLLELCSRWSDLFNLCLIL